MMMHTLEISKDDLFEIQMILDDYADNHGQKSCPNSPGEPSPSSRLRGFRILGTPYGEPAPFVYPAPEDTYLP